jgi:hypothetical protein
MGGANRQPSFRRRVAQIRCRVLLAAAGGLALGIASGGCHSMQVQIADVPAGQVDRVEVRNSFFFWGLAPTRRIDVRATCPAGAAGLTEETTFTDGFFNLITLGIWAPRSVVYYCRVPLEA